MKKLIMLLLACVLVMPVINADSAVNKELQKAIKKEKKEKMKEYKKEGWKLFGSSRSLEVALLSHYDKLEKLGEDGREVAGVASKFKSKSIGHQMAINDACLTYSQQAGSSLKGRHRCRCRIRPLLRRLRASGRERDQRRNGRILYHNPRQRRRHI